MDRRQPSPGALIGGVVLLVIGGAFLLRNAGIIRVDWSIIWPAILVAIGVVIIVWALQARSQGGRSVGTGDASVSVPVEGAGRLELTLRVGAGQYRLAGGTASGVLVEAQASDSTIASAVDRSGDLARVRLSTAVDSWAVGRFTGTDWRIGVAPGVPVMLDIQAGAGGLVFDLESVAVAGARLAIGAAELRMVLPRPRGEVAIRVEGGAASFTFEVPAGVQARVTTSGLLTVSGPMETPGWSTATDRVSVSVTGGAAAVRVVSRE
jgi:hypothetical protein